MRRAVPAPFDARPDWSITCDFARRLEALLRPGLPSLFDFTSSEALFEEYKHLTAQRDLDLSGLSYAPVSYTHLDVYKRQSITSTARTAEARGDIQSPLFSTKARPWPA